MTHTPSLVALVSSAIISTAAQAGSVTVHGDAGDLVLQAGSFNNVLSSSGNGFSVSDLHDIHEDLNDDGVSTNSKVTIVLAYTDAGLSLLALVDRQWDDDNPNGGSNAKLDVWSEATANDYFVNGSNEDIDFDEDSNSTEADGYFKWNSDGEGDALAWSGLGDGDHGEFKFKKIWGWSTGLTGSNQFQFVSWNGSKWIKVASGEFDWDKKFNFDFWVTSEVIPLPPAVLLGLVGFVGVGAGARRCRRRG